MASKRLCKKRWGGGLVAVGLAGALALAGVGTAFAATETPFGTPEVGAPDSNLITTYGVRAGSAGPDFLGITNTNFDFTKGSAGSLVQFPYSGTDASGAAIGYGLSTVRQLAGLSIWGTTVNTNANRYYGNLLSHAITGTATSYSEATTWMSNPVNSWGDSNNQTSKKGNVSTGADTIAGLEYDPEIIFGANKYTNWNLLPNGSNSNTNMYTAVAADENYNPTFVNNDATNLWTQVYTMGQLATTADGLKSSTNGKITRYNNNSATQAAIDYEKATRGQMLYIASKIYDGTQTKKTVAYLYAIDADGTGYFFVPTASGLLNGNDTGKGSTAGQGSTVATGADGNYAANNSTINMGYMAALPFITNTFDSGNAFTTTTVWDDLANNKAGAYVSDVSISGIVMKVEDIYKANPACTVAASNTTALANVNVIIFNSTVNTDLKGTSGGKNLSGVNNDYQTGGLTASAVTTWAQAHGFPTSGTVIAGDDFGTSSNQSASMVTAPLLYCQRNYTCDKNTRAAWAFSQVYPELYGSNANASYGYWVNKVYHVVPGKVSTVGAYMTNQAESAFSFNGNTANTLDDYAEDGYDWWMDTGRYDSDWNGFSYYTGSSRASYYGGTAAGAEEATGTIGIFAVFAVEDGKW